MLTFAPKPPRDFSIADLGPRKVASPYKVRCYATDDQRVLLRATTPSPDGATASNGTVDTAGFEMAGPRAKIYFDPAKTRCGIVTCGGLCPGLNDVIRAIVLQLYHHYGVKTIYGFRYGFEGLMPQYRHAPIMLDPAGVSQIHERGGTVLSSSRGPQPSEELVDALERLNLQVLFCIGGDGTLRGALDVAREIRRRALKIGIVAVPKTIDNDISFTTRTFGFDTAYSVATGAIRAAHVEATGAFNGIGLVKLMGRHAGFIAAHAALASGDVNFVLVPEVDFELGGANGFLTHLYRRLRTRQHAVVVVAEGAGQSLFEADSDGAPPTDASGNPRLKDIGVLLRDRIKEYLHLMDVPFCLKYIDPSYLIRSEPATPSDSLFAGILGQMATHAAMAGKTAMFVGYWNDHVVHVPIEAAVSMPKRIDPAGNFWQSVIESTGQPAQMVNDGETPAEQQETLLADAPA